MKFIPIQINHQLNILSTFQNENKYTLFEKIEGVRDSLTHACVSGFIHQTNNKKNKRREQGWLPLPGLLSPIQFLS